MVHSDTIKSISRWMVAALMLIALSAATMSAQKTTITDDYIFFIDGANVLIPTLDGSTANDPLDPTSNNKVFAVTVGNWAESGFLWPEGDRTTTGVDMSGVIGVNYGESDTLYVRFLSDSANVGKPTFLSMFDNRTGLDYETDDLPFRLLWQIPDEMSNNQWHDMAIPLPPLTRASLDSAKAGKKLDGSPLDVEVDSLLLAQWQMPGAWANGQGVFSPEDPKYVDFDFESVTKFGAFFDTNAGPGPIYFDYYAIGVPPAQLVDTPPAAVASVNVSNSAGTNTVTWPALDGAGGYNVYFSESPITSVTATGVSLLGAFTADATLSQQHTLVAPHPSLAASFTGYYAVTAKSPFGAESAPTSVSATGDLKVAENYAFEMSSDALDALYGAIESGTLPPGSEIAANFPATYTPFTINQERMYDAGGIENITGDEDLSAKLWVGFGATDQELVLYAEVMDDQLVAPPLTAGDRNGSTGGAWNYDTYEMAIGNYSPESFISGSTNGTIPSGSMGENPDYQFRVGFFRDGGGPFVHDSWTLNGEVPFSQTIIDTSASNMYRMLTIINTIYLRVETDDTPNELFDFPTGTEVKTYPFNYAVNDADETFTRDAQASWSSKSNSNWYNTPSQWEVVAFVGKDAPVYTPTSVEEPESLPFANSLDQNYPNPFNPTTNINFTLQNTANVSLEVYNVLGKKVATLVNNQTMTAGKHNFSFNATNLPSGMYLYRITAGDFTSTRKMMLIK